MPYCKKMAISFLLTTQCNLRCKYCYGARNFKDKTLDWDFAKRAIEDYVGGFGGLNNIRFYADGEPTLEMDILKKIYEHASKLEPNLQAEINTNGIFSIDTAEWLGKNMDYIYISVDLLPEHHDKYRITLDGKPSSPLILENLKYFKDMKERKAKIGIRATITTHNIEHQIEAIDYYYDNYGIDIFWVNPIFPPVSEVYEKTYEPIDMEQFATTFVKAHNHAWERNIFYESKLTTNFDGETNKACPACIPMPHLTTDGYISACDMATYGEGNTKMDDLIYGKYDSGKDIVIYDDKKINTIQSRVIKNMYAEHVSDRACLICPAGKHCAGYCPGETLNENGDLFRIKNRICRAVRYIYGEIGHLYKEKYQKGLPHAHP